jgi:DNA-directed RNA polymerase II subunit RPB2
MEQMKQSENFVWDIIDKHFNENPQSLVRHHIESYNDFFKQSIYKIFKEKNPIQIVSKYDESIGEYRSKCNMYIGGKNGDLIHFAKPVIYDSNAHYMFPNEARLRNMTYAMTIHFDVDLEFIDILEEGELPHIDVEMDPNADPVNRPERLKNYKKDAKIAEEGKDVAGGGSQFYDSDGTILGGSSGSTGTLFAVGGAKTTVQVQFTPNEKADLRNRLAKSVNELNIQTRNSQIKNIFFGKFPIMIQSDFCILSGLPREMRFNMGECKNDIGGYFIIDGKEKTIIPQEKFGDNMLRISKVDSDKILFTAEIKSVSENTSKPIRTLRVELVKPGNRYSNMNIVVNIPNVRKPVPLFIVFRALGIVTDKDIIETCLLDLDKNEAMMDLFIPSIHDAGFIMTQPAAIHYIAHLTKTKTNTNALFILTDYFLPHIGETNYTEKAYFLGYMVKRLLSAYQGMEPPIDRDSFRYKRVELVGTLMYELFREYYKAQMKHISVAFEKKLYYNLQIYENDLHGLVMTNYKTIFGERIVEEGFRRAFKGNWGSSEHTKRIGAVQDLNRLSFNSALSHLRKTNLSIDAGAKLVGPRILNGSQWGLVDPIDTPDGGNIGLHKQLCIMTYVSRSVSREPMIKWLKEKCNLKHIEECGKANLAKMTKVMINGYWAGSVLNPMELVDRFKIYRRNGLIPLFISICFESQSNMISIFTDEGRLCRPIFYYDTDLKKMSFEMIKETTDFSWAKLLSGFNKQKTDDTVINSTGFYELYQVYDGIDNQETNPTKLKRFIENKGIIDYIDPNEEETSLICLKMSEYGNLKKYTHCEIHESFIFGMMCNLIIYPHHNPAVRNSFSTGQSKQAVSMYHTNFTMRMDKTALILNQGQKPLVKSRYYDHICHEENSYGENTIVALMCYTGYNVEDAVLINEGALQRGLFRTTYYSVYESHEERSDASSKRFININDSPLTVRGIKSEHDYSKLDQYGLVKEGTEMNDRTVIIGCAHFSSNSNEIHDASKTTKKGQLGIVDKAYITEGEEGTKIAKVRIREERLPAVGDKMASRSGQKGTIGQIIPERDMPFTKNGLRPDIIVNPHAMPTRMTVGQLVECLVGKACLNMGYHGDCTAFMSSDKQIGAFGEILNKCNYHSSGNELLYNGMTGEQLEAEVYIGPNYYMRLKHMVKDKVNFRAKGPRTQLTRQPVSGRANDGGLRIGEMERDVIISHGATDFLRESMMDRGDKFYMAVCNKTGAIAIYNPEKNMFMSPMADGPLKFTESLDGMNMNVEHITKYGRSFSVVLVPYVFKLLMHELQAMNVKMSIITEDNINQFDNMNFSKNIQFLTGNENPQGVINNISDKLKGLKPKATEKEEIEVMLEKVNLDIEPVSQMETADYIGEPKYVPYDNDEYGDYGIYKPTNEYGDYDIYKVYDHDQEGGNDNANLMPQQNQQTEFQKNDYVSFGGDHKKDRKWMIKNRKGDFATIETNDLDQLSHEDCINVVNVRDLVKYDNLLPIPSINPSVPHQNLSHNLNRPVGSIMAHEPGIQFAPVINVVTGSGDNKIETQQIPATTQQIPSTTQQIPSTTQQIPSTTQQIPSTTIDNVPMIKKPKSISFDQPYAESLAENPLPSKGAIVVKKL